MADGLLTSILGAIDRQKQATKAGLGLLVSDPMEFARSATARYFPTPEEVAQQRALEQFGGMAMNTPYMDKMFNLAQFQGSIKPTGLLNASPIEVSFIPKSNFLFAKNKNGLVGGNIKDNTLRITTAEVDELSRGKGIGTNLYKNLIDDALSKGLKVTSDFTVEAPAVRVYESLKKQGYDVRRLGGGTLEDGSVFGTGATNPAFEIISAPKQKK